MNEYNQYFYEPEEVQQFWMNLTKIVGHAFVYTRISNNHAV